MAAIAPNTNPSISQSHPPPLGQIYDEFLTLSWSSPQKKAVAQHNFISISRCFNDGIVTLTTERSITSLKGSILKIAQVRGLLEEHYFLKRKICLSPKIDRSVQTFLSNITCITALYTQYLELGVELKQTTYSDPATNHWIHYKITELNSQINALRTATLVLEDRIVQRVQNPTLLLVLQTLHPAAQRLYEELPASAANYDPKTVCPPGYGEQTDPIELFAIPDSAAHTGPMKTPPDRPLAPRLDGQPHSMDTE